jgi:hypothetical protein
MKFIGRRVEDAISAAQIPNLSSFMNFGATMMKNTFKS